MPQPRRRRARRSDRDAVRSPPAVHRCGGAARRGGRRPRSVRVRSPRSSPIDAQPAVAGAGRARAAPRTRLVRRCNRRPLVRQTYWSRPCPVGASALSVVERWWKYGRWMILVGLTGGIGAGKSTVSAMLAERGAVIIDADAIAREVQQAGSPVLAAMAERFGGNVIAADGSLDRAAVAAIV